MDKRIFMLLGAVILIGGIIFLLRYFLNQAPECTGVILKLSGTDITVGDSLNFDDQTPDAKDRVWDFGDNFGTSDQQKGTYFYQEPGSYWVKLKVNDKCVDSLLVAVSSGVVDTSSGPKAKIIAKAVAYVGEKISFKADAPGAKSWKWKFGESGSSFDVEGKSNVEYTYRFQNKYSVQLYTDLSKYPATWDIKIEPRPIAKADPSRKPTNTQKGTTKLSLPSPGVLATKLNDRANYGRWKSQDEKDYYSKILKDNMATPVSWNIKEVPVSRFDYLINEFNTNPGGFKIISVSYETDSETGMISSLTLNAERK